jgi:hypothetical protein
LTHFAHKKKKTNRIDFRTLHRKRLFERKRTGAGGMEPIDEVRVSAVADEIVGRELCVEKVKSTGITWVQHWTDEWRKKNGQAAAKEEPEPARSPSPRPTRQTRSAEEAPIADDDDDDTAAPMEGEEQEEEQEDHPTRSNSAALN